MSGYCLGWPPELKKAADDDLRAECRLRCLMAQLDRIEPEEFDGLMDQITAAREERLRIGAEFNTMRLAWYRKETSGT